jgi:hypothetical protein
MPETRKVEIRKQIRLFDDFFKVDEILVAHEQRDGTMSSDQRRLVFERGDAVAALLYEPDTHTVIMVNQFRVPMVTSPSTIAGTLAFGLIAKYSGLCCSPLRESTGIAS